MNNVKKRFHAKAVEEVIRKWDTDIELEKTEHNKEYFKIIFEEKYGDEHR